MESDAIIESIQRAIVAAPDDLPLRFHLIELLCSRARYAEALSQVGEILALDPGNTTAPTLLLRISQSLSAAGDILHHSENHKSGDREPSPRSSTSRTSDVVSATTDSEFDWAQAEEQVGLAVPPPFASGSAASSSSERADEARNRIQNHDGDDERWIPEDNPATPVVTLADVSGLDEVKRRLNESFLIPMRNTAIAQAFGKTLRGGLLLYGPPGCGKTFIARAIAGELGARFMTATLTDIVSAYVGQTEKNLKAIFDAARAETPTVLFLDEIDSIGLKRSELSGSASWLRQMVNQLLLEMDSMTGSNDGLYVLAATNHPWDLDEALLRPGRLDRSVLVVPPDATAREAILQYHLQNRPISGIDLPALAAQTDSFSGADLEHLCTTAAEKAMLDSITAGEIRPLSMHHMLAARAEVQPSTVAWLDSAKNIVRFANANGRYDDLRDYLDSRKIR